MNCPACGTPNDPGRRFCGECGTPLAVAGLYSQKCVAASTVRRRSANCMMSAGLTSFRSKKNGSSKWYIPGSIAVDLECGEERPLDPYLLGLLLGDDAQLAQLPKDLVGGAAVGLPVIDIRQRAVSRDGLAEHEKSEHGHQADRGELRYRDRKTKSTGPFLESVREGSLCCPCSRRPHCLLHYPFVQANRYRKFIRFIRHDRSQRPNHLSRQIGAVVT